MHLVRFGVYYVLMNFLGTKIRGQPVYPFMTWDSWKSPVLAAILLGAWCLLYLVSCRLVNWCKGKHQKKEL